MFNGEKRTDEEVVLALLEARLPGQRAVATKGQPGVAGLGATIADQRSVPLLLLGRQLAEEGRLCGDQVDGQGEIRMAPEPENVLQTHIFGLDQLMAAKGVRLGVGWSGRK